ncbi:MULTISPECIES: hypothetical protein [unclassified Sphingomonas]|uniref:hypothetical protein n=1 Tax=unclassified Sphingomonas TaxID=196159 RepID=UPI002150AC49|nr:MULTISPECIES: hypothetical protein [unclassified Sphingomonas]MCR5869688.1 hypothetical protein [Sphingomonas sp. J344]UUX98606.1 hypothetical protein LRS08_13790 [Sphingomonas sp. J315]
MDLNYLLYRHQVSLMRAKASDCRCASRSHRGLAHGYAERIRVLRSAMGEEGSLTRASC